MRSFAARCRASAIIASDFPFRLFPCTSVKNCFKASFANVSLPELEANFTFFQASVISVWERVEPNPPKHSLQNPHLHWR